jgi:hypothetical protein
MLPSQRTINIIGRIWSNENARNRHHNENGDASCGYPPHVAGL